MKAIQVLKPYLPISKKKSKHASTLLPHKLTALTLSVLFSTIALTGCDKLSNSKTESTVTESDKGTEAVTKEATKKEATEKLDKPAKKFESKYTVGDGQATADMMAVSLLYPIQMMYSINDSTLTPDNVACIQQINYRTSATTYQKFLKDKFTTDEINQLDSFYATELGANLTNVATQQINKMAALAEVKGSVVNAPSPAEELQITPKNQIALMTFNKTEVGSKLAKHIMSEVYMKDGLINYTLPALAKELKNCDLKAPTKQDMDSWSVAK